MHTLSLKSNIHVVKHSLIGVLDGVGGWIRKGVHSGVYSKKLAAKIEELIREDKMEMIEIFARAVDKIEDRGSTYE